MPLTLRSKPLSYLSNQTHPRQFTCFPKLPQEIRLTIWEYAAHAQEPRVVSIKQRPLKKTIGDWEKENKTLWPPREDTDAPQLQRGRLSKDELREWVADLAGTSSYQEANLMGIACETPPPPVMLVCREARIAAGNVYKCAFACPNSNPETDINFKHDILYLGWENFRLYTLPVSAIGAPQVDAWNGFRKTDGEDLAKVENLAIKLPPRARGMGPEGIAAILRIFRGVQTLSLILQHYHDEELPEEDQSDLCMTTPIDVEKMKEIYEQFDIDEEYERVYGIAEEIGMPEIPWMSWSVPDMAELKRLQMRDQGQGRDWSLPYIERRTIAPRKTLLALDDIENACWMAIEEIKGR
ncbi:uncharacterized protein PAC_12921 [Phialocephala subalpina]|uniref:2EXR domain-containing protein n=1 Tax=Phialocephala subalpina TaxID=576137 RepID=A0A1L7XDB6_9HELO|nr:uncharacterized protein PAC_12921 [Phialocephala subalpina]